MPPASPPPPGLSFIWKFNKLENNWSFVAGVRGKACFTHDTDHFGHDVREKRFNAYGTHEKQIEGQGENPVYYA